MCFLFLRCEGPARNGNVHVRYVVVVALSFCRMRDQYIRTGEGFFLVYAITSMRSFEAIRQFYDRILVIKELDYFPVVIIGNKCDLASMREVPTEKGQALAKEIGAPFFETSARMRINVEESFVELVRCIRRYKGTEPSPDGGDTAELKKKNQSGKKKLCTLL